MQHYLAQRLAFVAVALGLSCQGPPAPDAAVCQDVVGRLCHYPRCPAVDDKLAPSGNCDEALLARTGCGDEGFSFTTVRRERVLECRLFLVRRGLDPHQVPSCDDVDEFFELCPDVVSFLREGQP